LAIEIFFKVFYTTLILVRIVPDRNLCYTPFHYRYGLFINFIHRKFDSIIRKHKIKKNKHADRQQQNTNKLPAVD